MKKNKTLSILIALVLLVSLMSGNVSASAYQKETAYKFPTLATSMGIKAINVDLSKVADNRLIPEHDQKYLLETYPALTQKDVVGMTIQEMNDYITAQPMDEELIKNAKFLYKELQLVDLSKWTVGDWNDYVYEKNQQPLDTDIFRQRGITDEDVKYLIKEYQTNECLAKQTDETIREYLTTYYNNKLEFAKYITSPGTYTYGAKTTDPPGYLQGTTYRWISSVTYYHADWFHEYTSSYYPTILSSQMSKAYSGYQHIFSTGSYPVFTNLWGTWSQSRNGAHEGIDMDYDDGADCIAVFSGSTGIYSTVNGVVYLKSISYGKVFYAHMSNRWTGSTATTTTVLGKQSNVHYDDPDDPDDDYMGSHLHLEATSYTGVMHSADNNNNLDSLSPYAVMP